MSGENTLAIDHKTNYRTMITLLVCLFAVVTRAHPVKMKTNAGTTCFLNALDEFTCIGSNEFGELGLGHTDMIGDDENETGDNLPVVDLGGNLTVVDFAVGEKFVCVLRSDAKIVCWGRLSMGANGMSTETATHSVPSTAIISDTGSIVPTSVHAGTFNVFVLDSEGNLYGWGPNYYGDLGYESSTSRVGPDFMGDNLIKVDLGTGRTAVDIKASSEHTCALLDDATIKCWGSRRITGKDDNVWYGEEADTMGDNNPIVDFGSGFVPMEFEMLAHAACARSTLGDVKCWGTNDYGDLGVSSSDVRVPNGDPVDIGTGRTATHISAGYDHVCVILDNDDVVCWGNGEAYKLGNERLDTIGDGASEMGDNLIPIDLGKSGNVKTITCGYQSTCLQFTSDKVKCYGSSEFGALGYGNHLTMGEDLSTVGYIQYRGFIDTEAPTLAPTVSPTEAPSGSPTVSPTVSPTLSPSISPTLWPTMSPTVTPTLNPTRSPTLAPSEPPSMSPSLTPTFAPTELGETECTIVITAQGDSSLTWDLTDAEGDEEIASGDFDGASITIIGETSEDYLLFLSSSTIPSGTITVSVDGVEQVFILDGSMSVDSEITDVNCAGVASATSDDSSSICLNLAFLFPLFLI